MSALRQILVLDSDDAHRVALIGQLSVLGTQAGGAATLEEARARIAEGGCDAIIASLQHAEGNPLDLLGRISEGRPLPPIIAVSSVVRRQDLIRAIRTPVCDFLEQPVSLSGLACALERAAHAVGVAPRTSAVKPDAFVRALRQAMGAASGAEGLPRVCARGVSTLPTMRAAWRRLRDLEELPALADLEALAAGMPPLRLAAATIATAGLAEAYRLHGAWQVEAEAGVLRAIVAAQTARQAATQVEVDPDTAFLASMLRGMGSVLLLLQAAGRYAAQGPSPEVLSRVERAGPRTAGAMFRAWSIPTDLLDRFAVPQADGLVADSLLARLLDNPAEDGPPGDAAETETDWPMLLRGTWRTIEQALALAVPEEAGLACSLRGEHGEVPARVRALAHRGVQVELALDGADAAASLLEKENPALRLYLRAKSTESESPVSVSLWQRTPPYTTELRFQGTDRFAARARSVVLLAMNRRQVVRVDGDDESPVIARLGRDDGVELGVAALVDLSTGGFGLLTDPRTAALTRAGGTLVLTVPLPTQALPLRVTVRVVHSKALRVEDPESHVGHDVVRLGLAVEASSGGRARIEQALTQYVMRRQREALRQRS